MTLTIELRDKFYDYYQFYKTDGEFVIEERNGQISPISFVPEITEYPFFNKSGYEIKNQKELESYLNS